MSFGTVGSPVSGTGTSAAVPVPSGVAANDIIVVGMYCENGTDATSVYTTGIAAGFTVKSDTLASNSVLRGRLIVFWKRATAADTGTYTFSWTTSCAYEAVAERHTGIDTSGDPFDDAQIGVSTSTTALTQNNAALSSNNLVDLVHFQTSHATNAGAYTPPTGYTQQYQASGTPKHLTLDTLDNQAVISYQTTGTGSGTTGNTYPRAFLGALRRTPILPAWVTLVSSGSSGANLPASTSTFTVTLPTHASGDRIRVAVSMKPDTTTVPAAPSGWSLVGSVAGGSATATGSDVGPVAAALYERDAVSSSETNPVFNAGVTAPSVWQWSVSVWRPGTGKGWADSQGTTSQFQGGVDTATGTITSAVLTAFSTQPSAGDAIQAGWVTPSSTNLAGTWTLNLSATGPSAASGSTSKQVSTVGNHLADGFNNNWTPLSAAPTSGVSVTLNHASASGEHGTGVLWAATLRQGIAPTVLTPTQPSETDTALTATVLVGTVLTPGQPSTTNVAQTATTTAGALVAPGQPSVTNNALTATTTAGALVAPGQPSTTNSALAASLLVGIVLTTGQATESDSALAGTSLVGILLTAGQPQESDSALAATLTDFAPTYVLPTQPAETDSALTVTLTVGSVVTTGQATEADAGLAATTTAGARLSAGQPSETDTTFSATVTVGARVTAGQPAETDSALGASLIVGSLITAGQPTETDSGLTVAKIVAGILAGQATETDSALTAAIRLGNSQLGDLNQALETDTGRTFTVTGPSNVTIALGQVSETDEAHWITVPLLGGSGDLTLHIVDNELVNTPANVLVTVGNGDDGETITFSLSGPSGYFSGLLVVQLDDEDGIIEVSVPLPEVAAGTYVLTAAGGISGSATDQLTVLSAPLDGTPDDDDNTTPDVPDFTPDSAQHWQLIDTTIGDGHTFTFPHNPEKWTNPNRPNFLEHEVTSAPDGNVLAWEGAERSWIFEFSGYLDTQELYEALEFWSNLRRRFWLIDHRNKAHYVTFEQLDVQARIVPNKPWAHNYTVRAIHFYRDGTA